VNPACLQRISVSVVAFVAILVALLMVASAAVPVVMPPADASRTTAQIGPDSDDARTMVQSDQASDHTSLLGATPDGQRVAAPRVTTGRSLPARVDVRWGCGTASSNYAGPLQVAADGVRFRVGRASFATGDARRCLAKRFY
jgi:hypothetical protein